MPGQPCNHMHFLAYPTVSIQRPLTLLQLIQKLRKLYYIVLQTLREGKLCETSHSTRVVMSGETESNNAVAKASGKDNEAQLKSTLKSLLGLRYIRWSCDQFSEGPSGARICLSAEIIFVVASLTEGRDEWSLSEAVLENTEEGNPSKIIETIKASLIKFGCITAPQPKLL